MPAFDRIDQPFLFNRSAPSDRILVVDDSPDNSFLIQTILKEEGYSIDIVNNGIDALACIQEAPPNLVLLDVMMPGMDGFEVTRQIRQNSQLPFIPILLITAHDKPSVAQGLDIGAEDFIRKPVEFDELLARVRSLLKLKHSVDEREHIARQREDFVSRLTHDLRTPLVAADRMLSLIQQGIFGELSEELQEAIAVMSRSNCNLLEMVNTLLQVYCYEAGKKKLVFASVDLHQLLLEVVQALKPIALDKGLDLKTNLQELSPPVEFWGDRMELQRVFTNLIGNAIKFTDAGCVEICLKPSVPFAGEHAFPANMAFPANGEFTAAKTSKASPWVVVEIRDTGVGIAPDEQMHLFEPFRHGNHKRSGSGLGLNLSCQIIKAHDGKLEVRSSLGKGSVFIVYLPIQG